MPTYKDLFYIKDATNNVIYQIKALSLKDAISIALSGDVTGTASTDFHDNVTISAIIENGHVTHSKLATDAVQNDVIKDSEITKNKFNPSVYDETDGSIADGTNSNLATKNQVKRYVESVIRSEGHYKGVQTVATINSWSASDLNNGDRVITASDPEGSGTGTLTLGNLPVVDGQEVIFYVSADKSVKIWQSSEGNYKVKQNAVTDPEASGTTITAIDSIYQNTNGDIAPTKKTIRSATTSQSGVVQLAGAIGSSVASENNKAASEKAVRDAINDLDEDKTSSDGTNVQVRVVEVDGKISEVHIASDSTENKNNKVTSWSSTTNNTHYPSEKLVKDSLDGKADKVTMTSGHAGNFASLDANGNVSDSGHKHSDYKTKQTAVSDPAASGNGISFISSFAQNENGEASVSKKTVPNVSASTSGTGGTNGLMLATDKEKLDNVSDGATKVEFSNTNGNIKIDGVETSVYSHPTAGANVSKGDTTAQTPGFGGTFKALSATVDAQGHTTALAEHMVTIPSTTATASSSGTGGNAGLMSAADKEKLDDVSVGATKVEASQTNGNVKIDGTETNVYTHPTSGANTSKGDTTAQTPGFGGTFKALSATVDAQGHTTALAEHNVTIPDAVATPSTDGVGGSKGLMSAADKEKLDKLASGEATKDKDEVVAAALDDLDARMHAVEESVSTENLGTRTADEIDAQVLKLGGEDVSGLLAGKVDKVEGKGLSKNDFTDAYKSAVDANTSARHAHSNKSVLDGISSSDVNNWNGKQAALTWMTDAEVDALWENAMMAAIAE